MRRKLFLMHKVLCFSAKQLKFMDGRLTMAGSLSCGAADASFAGTRTEN